MSDKKWIGLWAFLLGTALAFGVDAYRIGKLNKETRTTIEATQKELDETRLAVAEANSAADESKALADKETTLRADASDTCMQSLAGDGTKTILLDLNHPYIGASAGQDQKGFVFSIAGIPIMIPRKAGQDAGPAWIIPRRVVPTTLGATRNGIYGYLSPDNKMDGWYYTGGAR